MKFKRLEMCNWRSFQGRHVLDFSTDKKRNITVFVGQNGAGKTALLNAFTWVLFGETTAGFRKPSDLFNHATLDAIGPGSAGRMEIILEFEHDGAEYRLQRYQEALAADNGQKPKVTPPCLEATRRKGGVSEKVEQEAINAVLPPGLHPFFFFPAENIGKDIDQNDAAAIRASMSRAIDVLLGIERYDNARRIVSKALNDHLKTPKSTPKDSTVEAAEEEAKRQRQAWEEAVKRKNELPGIINQNESILEDLTRQLDATQESQEAIEAFNKVKADIEQEKIIVEKGKERQAEAINRCCAILFGQELFSDALEVLNKAHDNEEIPPKISAGLLDDLLVKSKCICGTKLGPDEKTLLEALRSQTVEDFIAEFASNLRGRLPRLIKDDEGQNINQDSAKEILDRVNETTVSESKLAKLEIKKREMQEERPEATYSDPGATMEAWKAQTRKCSRLEDELNNLSKLLQTLERAKSEAERKFNQSLNKHKETAKIANARGLLSEVEETLEKIQAAIRSSARSDVERAMNEFYAPLLFKDYFISLSEDFHYQIKDTSGRSVGASSSEVALATFAFVGALAGLMPVYASLERLIPTGEEGSIGGLHADSANAYPVVLDAPYSPFGSDYANRFSDALPELLPQSVIIVREDQLEYLDALRDKGRIGTAYILQLHAHKSQAKNVRWNQQDFAYVVNAEDPVPPCTKIASLPLES